MFDPFGGIIIIVYFIFVVTISILSIYALILSIKALKKYLNN